MVKIGDMGLSKITQNSLHAYTLAGTREYMSPEMYKCTLEEIQDANSESLWYSDKTDIWFAF